MATNLLRPSWGRLDSHELRILLAHRIGQPGQYDGREASPNRLYLPLAGAQCRVVLTFCSRKIVSVERGQGFDQSQWDSIANERRASGLGPSSRMLGPTLRSFPTAHWGDRIGQMRGNERI